jgi:hypothetical protein
MDADQLREIATGALTGHWPAHLGLNTDAEKIEWLARQVETLADNHEYRDDVRDCDECELCEVHS